MRKRFIQNLFLFTFALILITINYDKEIQGLPQTTEYSMDNNYISPHSNLIECFSTDIKSSEADLFLDANNVVEVFNTKYKSNVSITKKDMYLMAKVVFAESKGEPFAGKVAVASVILNRVNSPNFPNSIEGVIKQKNAFSCVNNGQINVVPNSDSYNAVVYALKGNDPTSEALYFYNPKIATCSWMKNAHKSNVKSIGQHVFFNIK